MKYFQALKREKEEKERLVFLLEVSFKSTTQPPIETTAPLLTLITKEPQEVPIGPVPHSLTET